LDIKDIDLKIFYDIAAIGVAKGKGKVIIGK